MASTPTLEVRKFGQSLWLDYIQRNLLESGEFQRLIDEDGIAGVTSNPAIFEKAILHHDDYDEAIDLLIRQGIAADKAYEVLVVEDITRAADLLRPFYRQTERVDGYVSLEVSPHLANDAAATVREAQRLWETVAKPNLMIKVPATRAGLDATRALIGLGINVNATLLFSVRRYQELAAAYMTGLESRLAAGLPINAVASVASFFVSRIDSLIDPLLDVHPDAAAASLRGQSAIASARLAYQEYKAMLGSARWQRLRAADAIPQRLLWASTSTKDPAYADVKYVEPLIGANTVNTLPPETLTAYRDHGDPQPRLEDDLDLARSVPARLLALGIDIEEAATQLEEEGIDKFIRPYDKLLATLGNRLTRQRGEFAGAAIGA